MEKIIINVTGDVHIYMDGGDVEIPPQPPPVANDPPEPYEPPAPTNLRAENLHSGTVMLKWNNMDEYTCTWIHYWVDGGPKQILGLPTPMATEYTMTFEPGLQVEALVYVAKAFGNTERYAESARISFIT